MNLGKTLIMIVSYNPDIHELELNVLQANQENSKIIILDNTEDKAIQAELVSLVSRLNLNFEIELIQFYENKGIAFAQNIGIEYALRNNFEYILELDQDTYISKNYIRDIKTSYCELYNNNLKILGIGPVAVDAITNLPYDGQKQYSGVKKVAYTLSSGFFYKTDVVEKVGKKKEGFFLDMVDWEWCIRARNNGCFTYIDSGLFIKHKIGNNHVRFLGVEIGNPSPFRHYYAFRNLLFLIKMEKLPFFWKIKIIGLLIFKFIFFPFVLDNGIQRSKYMLRGIADFISNKQGRLDD